jgi:hypothetical protein
MLDGMGSKMSEFDPFEGLMKKVLLHSLALLSLSFVSIFMGSRSSSI